MSIMGRDEKLVTEWVLHADQFKKELDDLARDMKKTERAERDLALVKGELKKATDALGAAFGPLHEQVGKLDLSAAGLAGALGGLAASAIPALIGGVKDLIGKFGESIEAGFRLNERLKGNEEAVNSLTNASKHLVSQETALDIVKKMNAASMHLSQQEVEGLGKGVVRLTAIYGDQQRAIDVVTNAVLTGQTRAIKALGIEVKDCSTLEEKRSEILKKLTELSVNSLGVLAQQKAALNELKDAQSGLTKELGTSWIGQSKWENRMRMIQFEKNATENLTSSVRGLGQAWAGVKFLGDTGVRAGNLSRNVVADLVAEEQKKAAAAAGWGLDVGLSPKGRERAPLRLIRGGQSEVLPTSPKYNLGGLGTPGFEGSVYESAGIEGGMGAGMMGSLGGLGGMMGAGMGAFGAAAEGARGAMQQQNANWLANPMMRQHQAALLLGKDFKTLTDQQAHYLQGASKLRSVQEQATASMKGLGDSMKDVGVNALGGLVTGFGAAIINGENVGQMFLKLGSAAALQVAGMAPSHIIQEVALGTEASAQAANPFNIISGLSVGFAASAAQHYAAAAIWGGIGVAGLGAGIGLGVAANAAGGGNKGASGYSSSTGGAATDTYRPKYGRESEKEQPIYVQVYIGDGNDPGAILFATKQIEARLAKAA